VSNVDSFFQENENIKALYGDCSLINVYRKESKNNFDDFDFQPVLCDNSLKIADRLEPAINRLTKAKKRNKTVDNSLMSEKSSNKSLTSIFHMRGLYDQAMTSIKTLDELRLRKRIIDENEFRNYPFKPSLNKNKSSYSLGKIVKKESANQSMEKYINCCNENTKLYERSFKWKEANEAKYKQIRTEKEKNKFVDCSFTPKLTSMNNSFTFSKSKSTNFINQANIEYANKRQNYLKKKEKMKKKL